MTTRQFRQALKRHDLSQREFGRQLPANPRTVNRWHTGESDIPQRVEQWFALRECRQELKESRQDYLDLVGILQAEFSNIELQVLIPRWSLITNTSTSGVRI